VRAPGTLASHYAPQARVVIMTATDAADLQPPAGLLALASVPTPPGVVRLCAPVDADDYARVLYAALREADALRLPLVAAVAPPPGGIGAAVIDRLTRAAAGS
jgi:L-threonylcarbamoyladenylate synthase